MAGVQETVNTMKPGRLRKLKRMHHSRSVWCVVDRAGLRPGLHQYGYWSHSPGTLVAQVLHGGNAGAIDIQIALNAYPTQSPNGNRISKLITAVYKVNRQDKTRHRQSNRLLTRSSRRSTDFYKL